MEKSIARVIEAIETIRKGGMVIMVDDEQRENEGDIVFAAEHATAEKINFMAKEARGLICLPMAPEFIKRLKLPLMDDVSKNAGGHTTAFTVSIEARHGVTTGISAADRAHTIRVAVADESKPEDLCVPGHVFPLLAKKGGVLERSGHTEGSIDLARLAGCKPAAVICEIMNDDGTMARMPDLERFAKLHRLPIITIDDIIAYRLMRDSLVKVIEQGSIETDQGQFESIIFESVLDGSRHMALLKGKDKFSSCIVDVRVHRQKPFIDVFSRGTGAKNNLIDYGLKLLRSSEAAALLYLSYPQKDAFSAESRSPSTSEQKDDATDMGMDVRLLGIGAQIIRSLGIQRMRTHVSQQRTFKGLAGFGLEIVDHILISSS
ncbi:MAG: 3,4-dihydroxy-2-butanone-4-phosphate synthase [bacterium]|jgi:3,4-dihydroxy 2-butanone 4-phosphate synthase/GTP cyclohydrolase II